MQVTRDRLLRDFVLDVSPTCSQEYGSGYPGGNFTEQLVLSQIAVRHHTHWQQYPVHVVHELKACLNDMHASATAKHHLRCSAQMCAVDHVTTTWLKANLDKVFGYPDLVRFSWQTTSRLLHESACAVHW